MLARCRKLAAAIGLVAGCIHSGNLFALGLGDLTVNSSLNEPLDATIQMLGLDGLTENQILTAMGGLEDFERAGIDRVGLIDNVILDVEVLDRERGILHITSAEPVVEPFLNMVISVRWPNGRLMRDYTALIDLPVFISDQPQATPVNVPETPAPARDPAPAPAPEPQTFATLEPPAQEEPPVSTEVESAGEDAGQQEAAVEDLIEEAAEDVAIEEEAAVEEEALEEKTVEEAPEVAEEPEPVSQPDLAEPEPVAESVVAFEESDEEPVSEPDAPEDVTVEAGDTLYGIAASNRPDTSVTVEQTMLAIQRANPEAFTNDNINLIRVGQILRIPAVEDIRSIDQAQAVRQIALQNQASTTQPLVFNTNNTGADQQGTDELTILSGDAGTESLEGDDDLASTIAALENQLAISEENLDRARLENQELRARYADLEEQIEILQIIIAMQDVRLAQMQSDLAQRAEAEAQAAQEQEQAPVPVEPPPAADNSLLGKFSALLENTMVLLGSLVGLILLVVGVLVWRRRAAQEEMDAFEIGGAALAQSPEVHVEPEAETETVEAVVVDAEPESTEIAGAEEQVVETATEADDTETFDFELGDLDTTAEDAPENVAGESDGADIESFDFSLDTSDDSSTAQAAEADQAEDDSADVESFDFDLTDTPAAPAEVAEETAEDDVETFDFDVSSISSFEEGAPESGATEETESDLETFTFDSPEPVDGAADAEVESDDSDDGAFVIDDIGLHDEPEQAPATPAHEEVDPLAAALDEIDAEAEDIEADEISLDDDLDLGSIEIDDSLFDSDEDGDEPISDRDESSTKLDLAVAYEAMGDLEGAREILNEVIAEGNGDQVAEAQKLLEKWGQS